MFHRGLTALVPSVAGASRTQTPHAACCCEVCSKPIKKNKGLIFSGYCFQLTVRDPDPSAMIAKTTMSPGAKHPRHKVYNI